MRLVMSKNRPGRKVLVPCRVVGAIVSAVFALTFWVGSAGAENRIYLECESSQDTFVTNGDMAAESIGDELAALAVPSGDTITENNSLVLSYHEAGQSTSTHAGPGVFQHAGLTVVRPVANSSPLFWKALATGEVWFQCQLTFTRKGSSSSSSDEYLLIRLQEVVITQIEPRAVAQLEMPKMGRSHLEAITLTFRKIRWTNGTANYEHDMESGP